MEETLKKHLDSMKGEAIQVDNYRLTDGSLALFLAYAKDAGNWSGMPLVGGNVCLRGSKEDRGNLTQLKKAGLITTYTEEGNAWLCFTEAGIKLANEHGIDLSWVRSEYNGKVAPQSL